MANEFNEGEFFEELPVPWQSPAEKHVAREIFGRLEEKKVATIPGVDMSGKHGNPVRGEFPRLVYNAKGKTKTVKDTLDMAEAKKNGWMTSKEFRTLGEPTIIDAQITDLLQQIADLIKKHEELTGKKYENSLEKMLKKVQPEVEEEE